jgi:hypothetical protein
MPLTCRRCGRQLELSPTTAALLESAERMCASMGREGPRPGETLACDSCKAEERGGTPASARAGLERCGDDEGGEE